MNEKLKTILTELQSQFEEIYGHRNEQISYAEQFLELAQNLIGTLPPNP